MNQPLPILYRDQDFVAVDKPVGMIVHRTGRSDDRQPALLQTLRDQIGQRIYPIHRLDQPTSGIILFGLDPTAAAAMVEQFERHRVRKHYQAVVAGWMPLDGCIDRPLSRMVSDGEPEDAPQSACTTYAAIRWFETSLGYSTGEKFKLSWIEVSPQSGRRHQIRRHLAMIGHPILGDYRHGDEGFNAWSVSILQSDAMMLSSVRLSFAHPFLGHQVVIRGPRHADFDALLERIAGDGVTMTAQAERT